MTQPIGSSPRALVVGGSLGGLASALELAAAGLNVDIFERSDRAFDDRGAGIVMQPETMHLLKKYALADETNSGVWSHYRQYLDRDGTAASRAPSAQLMTSWGLLFRRFRGAFPDRRYHEGCSVNSIAHDSESVEIRFADGRTERGDLLVCADGARSTCRQILLPDVKPTYAGYVAWRGVVAERSVAPALLATFADHFTFYQMPGSHILCYLIPGAEGELSPGDRRLNWVWYWNVAEDRLPELLTDIGGRPRDFSVPPGQVRPEHLAAQQKIAEQFLPPPFLRLFEATPEPFIQPILDLAVPRMAFGRTCLVGDAAFVPRPHTAASTSKALAGAIALGEALSNRRDILAALQDWEPSQLALGRELDAQGRYLGNRSQFPGVGAAS
jgi:2-polyprenyl-6-methoxyphenol hydroxylase-like FAD-dependent oxidoreductase